MNVSELRTLLEGVDGDVEIVNMIHMEQGRGGCGGHDLRPNIIVYDSGEMELSFSDDSPDDDDDEVWTFNEDEGYYTNKVKMLVIEGSCSEDWYE